MRSQSCSSYVSDADIRLAVTGVLYDKEIDLLLEYLEVAAENADGERENMLTLLTYFTENKDGLVPCHRRTLNLPKPPDGKEYRSTFYARVELGQYFDITGR